MFCSFFFQELSNKTIPTKTAYAKLSISFLTSHGNFQPKAWDIQRMAIFDTFAKLDSQSVSH